ncbi:SCO family protein [Bacillus carboniphilus]|uniref:SCO family protein n=1 Tax=Bacillus carboniphilus TaxID=86663 RepID=A0ABN0WWB6_9BACI
MKRICALLLIGVVILVTGCSGEIPNKMDIEVSDFSFTNQDGETVTLESLEGKVWIADFIFTNCTTVCMPMTFNMSKLQEMVKEEGLENVEFVSFSVDPNYDSPEVLKAYAEQFEVDFSNWNFLTGYSQKEIINFAKESFITLVIPAPEGDDQVSHGTAFSLVDQTGKVVQQYSGSAEVPYETIIEHIKILQ